MSLNKGKAKVKSTAKTAGTKKKAVMNSRNPKKPMAISGNTMNSDSMYKKGGRVKYATGGTKLPKHQDEGQKNRFNWPELDQRYNNLEYAATRNKPSSNKGIQPIGKTSQMVTYAGNSPVWEQEINIYKKPVTSDKDSMNAYNSTGQLYKYIKEFSPGTTPTRYGTRKKGGAVYKSGGTTKSKKFAALAPPYNKATAADRIAGAKKNARKK